jgi:hypothetical protein
LASKSYKDMLFRMEVWFMSSVFSVVSLGLSFALCLSIWNYPDLTAFCYHITILIAMLFLNFFLSEPHIF